MAAVAVILDFGSQAASPWWAREPAPDRSGCALGASREAASQALAAADCSLHRAWE